MRKLSKEFFEAVKTPVINIHPALLPKYGGKGMYGMNVHKAVFEAGEKESGATVHYVNEEYDKGEIITQKRCDISMCISPDEIAEKVLKIEHEIYPKTIEKLLYV
jgi:folate-dependent phosphoribosylglycinamide formyltransferase PurN